MQSSGKDASREEVSGNKRRLDPVMAPGPGDGDVVGGVDLPLPVEEIIRYPLPGYEAPMGLSFSPDDRRVAFLFSPDGTLHCRLFVFDTSDGRQKLLFAPPDGSGLQEGNLCAEERLRRERAREQGLGVTYYEWRFGSDSGRDGIVVPLPSGLDNRGTARRGLKFEGQLKHNVGRVDAEDQLTGAEWLMERGLSIRGHIGLHGWSYGGFLLAMCLARFPDVFSCAVAGAPVTAWDGYDTFYTEKYMGLPSENKDVYEFASIMHHVKNLKGKLLLVHGTIDENVHFRHTARLINSLIAARKPYDMLIFPDERHMPRGICDRIYMEERIQEFLDRNL